MRQRIQFWISIFIILLYIGNLVATQKPNLNQVKQITDDMASRSAKIDVNHISMWILPNGLFAMDPATGHSGLEYPKDSGKYAVYTAGPWIVGVTKDTRELRAAAADYFTDFQPGVILEDGAPDDPAKPEYKVYQFNKGDLIPQEAINQGCPAEITGDQMLFCVFNDANPVNHMAVWQTMPIGLEIRLLVWAYTGPTEALANTIFMRYEMINKGSVDIDSVYIGFFFDHDIGEAIDDYVGCDPELNLGYGYNGDATDDYQGRVIYGDRPPCIGCDLLKGPMVPQIGSSARRMNGAIVTDHRNLGMTAFFKYVAAHYIWYDPSLQSAEGGVEAYNNLKGLSWNGTPMVDPVTGLTTPFVNPGDPVSGTGWLASHDRPPGDNRCLLSSGPFEQASGDTQEVVIAIIAAQGSNHLESISWMRQYDKIIQKYYDYGFQVPDPLPSPQVSAYESDRALMLYWDDAADGYESAGYLFEGYNVYQGESAQGPWHRIAVYDQKNQIRQIMENQYCDDLGYFTELRVAEGNDQGVQHYHPVFEDRYGLELVNGRTYYYAVTAYAVHGNSEISPRVLETDKVSVSARPHPPEMKTRSTTADTVPVSVHQGNAPYFGDASAEITVIDPLLVTGHDYSIDFIFTTYDKNSPHSKFWFLDTEGTYATAWRLTDLTDNRIVLDDQTTIQGEPGAPIADGLLCQVTMPRPGTYGIDTNAGDYAMYGIPYGGVSFKGSRYLTGVDAGGNSFWGGLMIGEEFMGSTCTHEQIVDVRIDFVNDQSQWSNCSVFERPDYAFKGIGTFPGSAWDISDTLNPRQLNICFVEQVDSNAPDNHWDPIAADIGDDLGGREYLFIMASDYVEDPSTLYNDDNWGPAADVMFALWAYGRGDHTSDEEFTLTIHTIHKIQPGNSMSFSTAGLAPVRSIQTARSRLDRIQVYPNPYFGFNPAETDPHEHFVTFINLPEDECTIRIFSLSGQLIKVVDHTNGTVFDEWDLCNSANPRVRVASGMYIATIEIPDVGTKILKLAVIMPRE
jgi:hypothetical protein